MKYILTIFKDFELWLRIVMHQHPYRTFLIGFVLGIMTNGNLFFLLVITLGLVVYICLTLIFPKTFNTSGGNNG